MVLTLNLVAYARMGLCNPVSEAAVEALLDQMDPKPGDRAAELGCGNAALACLLARRGLQVSAFDRGSEMTDLARRHVEREGLTERVTVTAGEANILAAAAAPWRFISVMGAMALGDFERLAVWLEPGGWLLWGDLFWKGDPPEALKIAMGQPDYETDVGWRARGQAAGLVLIDSRISPDAEWDVYTAEIQAAIGDWAAENPDHPDRPAIERRAQALAALYGPAGRQALGFGLYLFRRPA